MTYLTRRRFGALATAALVSSLTRSLWAREVGTHPPGNRFYIALVADSHIIDDFYVKGSENGVEDNESILVTTPRLTAARDFINSLTPGHRAGLPAGRLLSQLSLYRLRLLLQEQDAPR